MPDGYASSHRLSGAVRRLHRPRALALATFLCGALLHGATVRGADEPVDAQALFRSGKYEECIRAAAAGIEAGAWGESLRHVKIRAELETGRHREALATLEAALKQFPDSIQLRLLAHKVYRLDNRPQQSEKVLAEVAGLVNEQGWRYTNASNVIALGRICLLLGADAKAVLETFYDRVKEEQPDYVETYLATGELALQKQDYALAAEAFRKVVELAPEDPEGTFGLAQAYAEGQPEEAKKSLARTLELNPRHVGGLLMTVDRLIDSEQYTQAREVLNAVLAVNAQRAEAWAYRAVLAHLEGDRQGEELWRRVALRSWTTNPEVDHLMGRKLSQKYRFAEGAAHQRQALEFDPKCVPAKIALSQDLLRLGEEEEGWRLADEAYEADGYNVVAHNLLTLRNTLERFKTLEADGIVLRMDAREADIYGPSALELLGRAREVLTAKYDVELPGKIVVEIFPEQKDFAVRTFGLPGGEGFLGVCFGNVITANSPASQGANPANWRAVLWHEFCHAVTLRKTRNRMPRWLSEGISVYEEGQADPSWGQSMNPRYRQMVLEGDLVPLSGLSGAFLSPPSVMHLQFAYYESSLAVEYLVEKHGLETLERILTDLAVGASINTVLQRHVGPLERLDEEFAEYARRRATEFGPDVQWETPELPLGSGLAAVALWSEQHPDNVPGLRLLAQVLIEQEQWAEAKVPLETLLRLCPNDAGPESAYLLLAKVHRELGETDAERAALEKLAALENNAGPVYMRLMELCRDAEAWEDLAASAERMLAVNPLLRAPHRDLARAAEAIGDPARAISSYRALLRMDPRDPAEMHYRLARLLQEKGELGEARRHVLMALEEAPRFRAALGTLLELADGADKEPAAPEAPEFPTEQEP